jgi:hypothetical protein
MRRQDDGSAFTGPIPGKPGIGDAVPAGLASRERDSRAATGLHSQALRPAARSWLTGVAGPRTESVACAPCNDTAVARREAPAPARAH